MCVSKRKRKSVVSSWLQLVLEGLLWQAWKVQKLLWKIRCDSRKQLQHLGGGSWNVWGQAKSAAISRQGNTADLARACTNSTASLRYLGWNDSENLPGWHCWKGYWTTLFSFSVSELPCGRRVWEFQSFSSQVRKSWPLSFQNYPSRQSQCTPVISGYVNPGQAVSPLCECTHYRGKGWSGSLNGCKCLAAKISKQKNLFLFKPWWTDICLPSVAACAKQQNCKVCVLKPQRNNWHAPTFL